MTRRPTYSWCLQISVPDIDASIDLHDMTDCTRNASLTLMVVFEYITTKRELLSLNTIHKHDGYGACFPEGLDCDQASAVESDISRYQTVIIRCWNPGWGWRLKDPRQQSTKVENIEYIVSELSKT
jgi:hypothetical protein